MNNDELIPAAKYVRASTELQEYSTENQSDAINEYAKKNNYLIVRTYEDDGKTGVILKGRDALKRLIDDVERGNTDFKIILVYDVSRWGRFQDIDESAYYEFLCKKAGIIIKYCAEQFNNDDSISSAVMKTLKRSMAAEYSRELSIKVFNGQCNLIKKGYKQGGIAGYGLRRMLIDQNGHEKGLLCNGEYKSLQTDRVILVPGPKDEISTVKWIYHLFIDKGLSEYRIAELLNEKGIKNHLANIWTGSSVRTILTNEKYIGNNVFNRRSFKLKKQRTINPPDIWVRYEGAHKALIDVETFKKAQEIIQNRKYSYSDSELLEKLKALYKKKNKISSAIINNEKDMPPSSVYNKRFNGLINAYKLIGYIPKTNYGFLQTRNKIKEAHGKLIVEILNKIKVYNKENYFNEKIRIISINNELTVSIHVSKCNHMKSGSMRWNVKLNKEKADINVVVRLDKSGENTLDYYLFPIIEFDCNNIRLKKYNGLYYDLYRYNSLDFLYGMAKIFKMRSEDYGRNEKQECIGL